MAERLSVHILVAGAEGEGGVGDEEDGGAAPRRLVAGLLRRWVSSRRLLWSSGEKRGRERMGRRD